MSRSHVAALVEDAARARISRLLRGRGWGTRTIAYRGYGSESFVRVFARVLLSQPGDQEAAERFSNATTPGELARAALRQRGWRAFATAPAVHSPATITIGERVVEVQTDRGGYIDVVIHDHGLGPGWHDVQVDTPDGDPETARVLVIGDDVTTGLVSDIDDTVLSTSLPRPLIAAYNTFVLTEDGRQVVPGMAELYDELLTANPGAPCFYLSTGAWNTAPFLMRFLNRNRYPDGPLLLTDWGPTNTGWFRSGRQHKTSSLERLAREFPQIRWILIGDDGQHDPAIYGDFAQSRPEHVDTIAIRQLTATEQVLSHGLPVSNEELPGMRRREAEVMRGPDGHALLREFHDRRHALMASSAPTGGGDTSQAGDGHLMPPPEAV